MNENIINIKYYSFTEMIQITFLMDENIIKCNKKKIKCTSEEMNNYKDIINRVISSNKEYNDYIDIDSLTLSIESINDGKIITHYINSGNENEIIKLIVEIRKNI